MKRASLWSLLLAVLLTGCGSPTSHYNIDMYQEALKREAGAGLVSGSEQEQKALRQFNEFYQVYSADVITQFVDRVYAENAYFGDPYAAMQGLDEIREYFVRMAEPVVDCRFTIDRFERAVSGDYFITWTMYLTIKYAPEKPIEALGISHVRFDGDGKVIFQQDYWDTSVVFERLPIAGPITRKIKQRMEQ